ncbi:hypothetical protein PtA15_2A739 [Puccinia triticina]|uniref:Uncharacterized protein n=1 Tax=Puccinia triticina TaxID=208348 RepID=A0ABY7CHZ8_9BASI|nr:uncharacterized protein PtA15_2A739 [Puccinia triticina]WAQ82422.1 hypothetical protein PtA15_2A739 [Puccinia triticina]
MQSYEVKLPTIQQNSCVQWNDVGVSFFEKMSAGWSPLFLFSFPHSQATSLQNNRLSVGWYPVRQASKTSDFQNQSDKSQGTRDDGYHVVLVTLDRWAGQNHGQIWQISSLIILRVTSEMCFSCWDVIECLQMNKSDDTPTPPPH